MAELEIPDEEEIERGVNDKEPEAKKPRTEEKHRGTCKNCNCY